MRGPSDRVARSRDGARVEGGKKRTIAPNASSALDRGKILLDMSCVFFGEPGVGKSPACYILAMLCARYQIHAGGLRGVEPSFRSTPDLDFLRGEEGRRDRPDVFDDGDFNAMAPKALKAFLDVMMEEAMTRERWGAAKFVRGQARFAADNKYDADMIPEGESTPWPTTEVDLRAFLNIIRPAFPKDMCQPDIMAVVKRASVILNTKEYVYVKLAAQPGIKRYPIDGPYITDEAIGHLQAFYRQGVKRDFGDLLEKELQMAANAFSGYEVPRAVSGKAAKAIADREAAGVAMFGTSSRGHKAKLCQLGVRSAGRLEGAAASGGSLKRRRQDHPVESSLDQMYVDDDTTDGSEQSR